MAKIQVYCDSGANIHSCRDEIIDTKEDWGIDNWEDWDDEDKEEMVKEWVYDRLDWGWIEEEEF